LYEISEVLSRIKTSGSNFLFKKGDDADFWQKDDIKRRIEAG
jgi:hypothetical protein